MTIGEENTRNQRKEIEGSSQNQLRKENAANQPQRGKNFNNTSQTHLRRVYG